MTPDAVVVGSGPNGLAAAITLAQRGLSVTVLEGHDEIGGGTRTAELTVPGVLHDVCSAIHPIGVSSPYLSSLPLADHGLVWRWPEIDLAHPLDDGSAAGFRERIVATHVTDPAGFEAYNPNYVGGDIAAGSTTARQLVARPRPTLDPYATAVPGAYLCSSSTPPGAGVHGMCEHRAAVRALRDL